MSNNLSIIDTLISLIYLNEFYMINGSNYSDYICDKHLPKYSKYINQINLITRHPSLFHLFGIYSHNPYTDFISFSNSIETPIYRERGNFKQYLNRCKQLLNFQIIRTNDNKESLDENDWIKYNLKLIKDSKVFSIRTLGKKTEILINMVNIRTKNSSCIWQRIFNRVVNDLTAYKQPIYIVNDSLFCMRQIMDLEYCVYPIGELTKKKWKIESSLGEILSCCYLGKKINDDNNPKVIKFYNVLKKWFIKVDWIRKKNYLMTIYLIEKKLKTDKELSRFYSRLLDIPPPLKIKILSYL